MSYPLREEGLQVDSAISMGNSLYAIMVGVIISVIVVVLGSSASAISLFGNSAPGTNPLLWNICMGVIAACWLAYYIYDWHDLNLVVIYDKKVAMKEMLTYFLCIFSISLCVVLALLGKIVFLAVIESIYSPSVAIFRNKLIDAPPGAGDASAATIFHHGKKVIMDKIQTKLLNVVFFISCFICLASVAMGIRIIRALPIITALGNLPLQITQYSSVVVAGMALLSKRRRSKHKIQREYKQAINTTIKDYQRKCHEVVDALGRGCPTPPGQA
jgi:hypothetical protein